MCQSHLGVWKKKLRELYCLWIDITLDVEMNRIKSALFEEGNFYSVSAVAKIKCIVDYVG